MQERSSTTTTNALLNDAILNDVRGVSDLNMLCQKHNVLWSHPSYLKYRDLKDIPSVVPATNFGFDVTSEK